MRYVPELDGLRAVAVVAVVLFHSAPQGPVSGGFVGVDLFFVLSSFLITGILAERPSLVEFYRRRALRLMPPLAVLLIGYLAIAPVIWSGYPHWQDALLTAVYASDYSYAFWRKPLYLQHTWSLAVEEQFYIVWPLALILLARVRRPELILIAAYVALTLWRLPFVSEWQAYYYRLDTHATGLVAGAWLFFALARLPIRKGHAGAAFALIVATFTVGAIGKAWCFITIAEVISVVLIASAVKNGSALLRSPPAVWIGRFSYAIYLFHFPIAYAVRSRWSFLAPRVLRCPYL